MPKFELTLSPEYVPDWSVTDAIREIFQNAIDQQSDDPENRMLWEYNPQEETLVIQNKKSLLEKSSILFGSTTKDKDDDKIGMFGEGYKLALLVLTRNGKDVEIHNYKKRELWKPSLEFSKKFNSQILVINTKRFIFQSVPNGDLSFIVKGITPEEFSDISRANLHVTPRPEGTVAPTKYGEILMGDDIAGEIYVNGLYVYKEKGFHYGYNIKPKHLKIGRDRKLVSSFDLRWITSQMWKISGKHTLLKKLVDGDAPDVQYLSTNNSEADPVFILMSVDFRGKYGGRAIPVATQEESEFVSKNLVGVKPVIVSRISREILTPYYNRMVSETTLRGDMDLSPSEILENFYKDHEWEFSTNAKNKFSVILKQSEKWSWD